MTLPDTKFSQTDSDSATDLTSHVGNTPLLPLQRLSRGLSPRVKVFAKAEWFNPGGSVKDRPALSIIQTALANGDLGHGKRLLDSTSGNMGISYATFGAGLGIPVTLTIPASASVREIYHSARAGRRVDISPTQRKARTAPSLKRVNLPKEKPDLYWYANQYNNPANWQAHYKSTGPKSFRKQMAKSLTLLPGLAPREL